jgi:hypothetical protein
VTTFTTLTPLGQGGFSMLINGQNLPMLLPSASDPSFTQTTVPGSVLYSCCVCAAYMLWSMCLAWIAVTCFSIGRRVAHLPAFSITHWCMIAPNASCALLSLELSSVLGGNAFFRAFGAAWACIVFVLWGFMFVRSGPAIWNGSMFKPASSAQAGANTNRNAPEDNATNPAATAACMPAAPLESVAAVLCKTEDPDLKWLERRPTLSSPPSYTVLCVPAHFQDLETAIKKLIKEDYGDYGEYYHGPDATKCQLNYPPGLDQPKLDIERR